MHIERSLETLRVHHGWESGELESGLGLGRWRLEGDSKKRSIWWRM
jgi:hypothetical protein